MSNQRIAYGLCKKYGIKLKDGATPADAWKDLKEAGHGDEVEKETAGGSDKEENNVEASNPKKLSEKMNVEGELSSDVNPDEEDKQAYKKYWNRQGKTDKEINLDRFDEIIKRSKPVRKQFNVGDELVDTSFGKTNVKVVRKLTPEEKWERSYANNPFAGDYYEVEHDSIGTPVKSIVWAGHLDRSTQNSASNPRKLAEKMK